MKKEHEYYDENDYSQKYEYDCIEIKEIIFKKFNITLSLKEAAHFWEATSSDYEAGWLLWDSEEFVISSFRHYKDLW